MSKVPAPSGGEVANAIRLVCLEVPVKCAISFVMLFLCAILASNSFASECPSNWKALHPAWIWCDDFETNKLSSYFDSSGQGSFARTAGVGLDSSFGMRAMWASGALDAGSLKLASETRSGVKLLALPKM